MVTASGTATTPDSNNPGSGYQVDDVITLFPTDPSTLTAATFRVTSVDENGGVTGVELAAGGKYTYPWSTSSYATTDGTGTGCKLTVNGDAWGIWVP